MVSERIVYFLFRWGQFFIDAAIQVIHLMTTPLGEVFTDDSFGGFLFNAVMWHLPGLSQYSLVDLLIGPGMVLLIAILIIKLLHV